MVTQIKPKYWCKNKWQTVHKSGYQMGIDMFWDKWNNQLCFHPKAEKENYGLEVSCFYLTTEFSCTTY